MSHLNVLLALTAELGSGTASSQNRLTRSGTLTFPLLCFLRYDPDGVPGWARACPTAAGGRAKQFERGGPGLSQGMRISASNREGDNAATAMKSVVGDPQAYDWEGDVSQTVFQI